MTKYFRWDVLAIVFLVFLNKWVLASADNLTTNVFEKRENIDWEKIEDEIRSRANIKGVRGGRHRQRHKQSVKKNYSGSRASCWCYRAKRFGNSGQ